MPGGRPTLYDPSFCERAVELGKKGYSPNSIACEFEVVRGTLQEWAKDHPEFLAALKRAKAEEQRWWERAGQDNLGADRFQQQVWRTSMQARFRDDYTERRELAGPDGGPVQVAVIRFDADKDELEP